MSKISDERKIKDAAMGELQTEKRGSRRIKKTVLHKKSQPEEELELFIMKNSSILESGRKSNLATHNSKD